MAEELFKNAGGKTQPVKSEPSGSPAVPGAQPKQPAGPADGTNQTNSGPSSVTPPAAKEDGKGDPAQTTQTPEDGKEAPSTSGSSTAEAINEPADEEDDEADKQPSELEMLKRRADMMGVGYSNNIGLDALKAKIQAKMDGEKDEPKKETAPVASTQTASTDVNALTGNETKPAKKVSLRQHLQREKMKLVRVRITNLDPKKKDLPGEIITVANEYLGTVRKFVPFGEVTDNGYHIPQCIYDMLKERTFVSIKTRKGPKGEQIVEHQNAREFSLEVLPPLTADELAKLGAAQQAAGGL